MQDEVMKINQTLASKTDEVKNNNIIWINYS